MLDFGTEVYSWIGRHTKGAPRKKAAEIGLDHYNKGTVFVKEASGRLNKMAKYQNLFSSISHTERKNNQMSKML